MTQDLAAKILFAVAFVVAAASASVAARRAAARHGATVNQLQHEVRWLVVVRGALGLVFYTALLSWLFEIPHTDWMQIALAWPVRWMGLAFLCAGVGLLVTSYRTLGSNYRGGIGLYEGHELVTQGPYRWVRHPIYVGFIVVMTGVALLSANWLLGTSGLTLVSVVAIGRLPQEERQLQERFGERWSAHRRRTGVMVPRWPGRFGA